MAQSLREVALLIMKGVQAHSTVLAVIRRFSYQIRNSTVAQVGQAFLIPRQARLWKRSTQVMAWFERRFAAVAVVLTWVMSSLTGRHRQGCAIVLTVLPSIFFQNKACQIYGRFR